MSTAFPSSPSRSDRGAGFIEYAGTTLLVGLLAGFVLVSVGSAGGMGQTVRNGINDAFCRAFSMIGLGDCELSEMADQPPPQPPPPCEVRTASSNRSLDGSFRSIRVEVAAGDQIVYMVDPVTGQRQAVYTTTGNSSVGAEQSQQQEFGDISRKLGQEGMSYEAFIQGGVGLGLNYQFEGEDAYEQAEEMQELRRGNEFQEWIAAGMGTQGTAIEGAAAESAKWAHMGWAELTGGDPEAVEQAHEENLPDSVTIDLNAQGAAQGSESLEGGGYNLGVEGGIQGALSNKVEIDRDLNRTHSFSASLDGNLAVEGGASYESILPAEIAATAEAAGGGDIRQRTQFDSDGNPVEAQMEVELDLSYSLSASGEVQPDLPPGVELPESVTENLEVSEEDSGHVRLRHTLTLDLTDEENRAAYEQSFNTDSGVAAIPNPVAMADLDNARTLGERFAEDGTQTQSIYEVEASDGEGYSGKRGGFGGSINTESTEESELLSMHHIDHRQPGARWEEVDCSG